MENLSIPPITDEELMRRYLKIKPIAKIGNVKYWLRDYSLNEIRDTSYLMSLVLDKRDPVGDALSCHDHEDFKCLHSYGSHGIFKPTIAEILAQITEKSLRHFTIDAFEIIDNPASGGNLKKFREAMECGYHISVVRLYIHPEP